MTAATDPTLLDPGIRRPEADPTVGWRRSATTAAAVAAPVLFTVSNVALPKLTGSDADVVAHIPPVADQLLASHLLYALASLLFIPMTIALWRIRVRRGSVLRYTGGLLLVVGATSNALGEVVDGYLGWGLHRATVDRAGQVRLFHLLDNSAAALPISFIAIPLLFLGLLVMMVGVIRARVVPTWLPTLAVVGSAGSAVVGVGAPALAGLVWSFAVAALVVLVARMSPDLP